MKAILGTIIHAVSYGELEILKNGAIVMDQFGTILSVFDLDATPTALDDLTLRCITRYDAGKFIIPGFIDSHCHAPQYTFSGCGYDLPLIPWLNKYTFPSESRFSDVEFAKHAYEKTVKRHLKSGTTFASYYATLHLEAAKILVDVINKVGQRAFVGKVSMDRNSIESYVETTEQGLEDAETFVRDVLTGSAVGKEFLNAVDGESPSLSQEDVHNNKVVFSSRSSLINKPNQSPAGADTTTGNQTPLVLPCITPRFVPTCTPTMMKQLGYLSYKYGLPVQSHLSESLGEIDWVRFLSADEGFTTYAGVYEKYQLLHSATFMGHCCHCPEEERLVLERTGAAAIHCPSSNFLLDSGVMDIARFRAEKVKVGLGTDVAGGASASMLDAMRQTIVSSRVVGFDRTRTSKYGEPCEAMPVLPLPVPLSTLGQDADAAPQLPPDYAALRMDYKHAFYLATIGGAEALSMDKVVGNFVPGKQLDCLIIDPVVANGPFDVFDADQLEDIFQKFIFLGDDRNIAEVFVNGKQII